MTTFVAQNSTCEREHKSSLTGWYVRREPTVPYNVQQKHTRAKARQGYARYVAKRRSEPSTQMFLLARELASAEAIEKRFQQLADQWDADTRNVSSLSALIAHPLYREIVRLDWAVVPAILRDLRDNRRYWFPALQEITNVKPFDPVDERNFNRMRNAWLRWGMKKGLL